MEFSGKTVYIINIYVKVSWAILTGQIGNQGAVKVKLKKTFTWHFSCAFDPRSSKLLSSELCFLEWAIYAFLHIYSNENALRFSAYLSQVRFLQLSNLSEPSLGEERKWFSGIRGLCSFNFILKFPLITSPQAPLLLRPQCPSSTSRSNILFCAR